MVVIMVHLENKPNLEYTDMNAYVNVILIQWIKNISKTRIYNFIHGFIGIEPKRSTLTTDCLWMWVQFRGTQSRQGTIPRTTYVMYS